MEYSEDVEQKLIDYYKEQISLCNSDSDLNQIVHKLDGLIKKYKLDYLTDVIKYAGKKSLQIKDEIEKELNRIAIGILVKKYCVFTCTNCKRKQACCCGAGIEHHAHDMCFCLGCKIY